MNIVQTNIPEVYIINNIKFEDERGSFMKIFHETTFVEKHLNIEIKEIFLSSSIRDVIRGMHFQTPPFEQAKIVSALDGAILDVALDIRSKSPTYGKYISMILSSESNTSIYIPSGFAHGFKTLSDKALVIYITTSVHSLEHDKGILWDSFGLNWGIDNPFISQRDRSFPPIAEYKSPF